LIDLEPADRVSAGSFVTPVALVRHIGLGKSGLGKSYGVT
jgi:hypothetical protein